MATGVSRRYPSELDTGFDSAIEHPVSRIQHLLRSAMLSLQVFYEGNVQGVGFRWTIKNIAKGFDVIGWVRNLPDGRVEMQVGGSESEVFAFLDSVMDSELRSHIDKQTRAAMAEPVKARGFDIISHD